MLSFSKGLLVNKISGRCKGGDFTRYTLGQLKIQYCRNKLYYFNSMCASSHFNRSSIIEIGVEDKVEKILKGSLDSSPSPSTSVKIQIKDRKACLRCRGKTLLGVVNKRLKTKSLLTMPSNVLPLCLKQNFLPIIWIFTKGKERW